MQEVEATKAHCNECGGDRQHEVLHKVKTSWEEEVSEDFSISGADQYEMIKCRGCERIALRHRSWFSEDIGAEGHPDVKTNYYPPATFRREPRWLSELMLALPVTDQSVLDLLKEVYAACQNASLRLAVMGIRALLEHVMIEKVGDHRTFKKNLDEFESRGFVSRAQRRVLEPVLEAGHATMHRSFKPSPTDLGALLDVTENLVESIYINELRAAAISKKVPPSRTK